MTKNEMIKEIKMRAPIFVSIRYLDSLNMDKLKVYYEKYVEKEVVEEEGT